MSKDARPCIRVQAAFYSANAMRPTPKELAVSRLAFGVIVDRRHDRANEYPAAGLLRERHSLFGSRAQKSQLRHGRQKQRLVLVGIEPKVRGGHAMPTNRTEEEHSSGAASASRVIHRLVKMDACDMSLEIC
jgi:hypothetical protein